MRVLNVLNLGAGWQSSRLLLGACRGELPRFDAAIFADTQWEPAAVYANVKFLRQEAQRAGIPLYLRSKGDLRADAIEFRRAPRSADGKRYASLPTFIKNRDGTQGRVRRQCTREYKIEVVDHCIRRELLQLRPRQRLPRDVLIRNWFGISEDERGRATFPGRFQETTKQIGTTLFGEPLVVPVRRWLPARSREHVYPLLNEVWRPDRTLQEVALLPRREQRADCGDWLQRHYPQRTFPRSACIGCPFRTNAEWREMRDQRPDEWADACDFDDLQRQADRDGPGRRGLLVGESYVHRQLVPLRLVDLDGDGERHGGGCGTLFDGQDGLCDV